MKAKANPVNCGLYSSACQCFISSDEGIFVAVRHSCTIIVAEHNDVAPCECSISVNDCGMAGIECNTYLCEAILDGPRHISWGSPPLSGIVWIVAN